MGSLFLSYSIPAGAFQVFFLRGMYNFRKGH